MGTWRRRDDPEEGHFRLKGRRRAACVFAAVTGLIADAFCSRSRNCLLLIAYCLLLTVLFACSHSQFSRPGRRCGLPPLEPLALKPLFPNLVAAALSSGDAYLNTLFIGALG